MFTVRFSTIKEEVAANITEKTRNLDTVLHSENNINLDHREVSYEDGKWLELVHIRLC
jgi:hypothetical protein